jgi:hypothetical protein
MAYSEQVATAITDIPALIAAFANTRGWTVAGTTLTSPSGTRSFEITASIGGTNNRDHRIFITDTVTATRRAWTDLPWVDGTDGNPTVLTPTKVHLFGNDTPYAPAAFIACVIECGYNNYRHLYIGEMVKVGNYTGGEVICANYFNKSYTGFTGGSYDWYSTANKFLFSAHHNAGNGPTGADAGGINMVHADNDVPYRYFDGPAGLNAGTSMTGVEVFGGIMDSINSGLVYHGLSDYAGAAILTPFNLFVPDSDNVGSNLRIRPVGYPAGPRMVNMESLEPGETIDVGGDNWKVFPEFRKSFETLIKYGTSRDDGGAGGYYPVRESSYLVGIAYPEG